MFLLSNLEKKLTNSILDSVKSQSEYITNSISGDLEEIYINDSIYLIQSDILKLAKINLSYDKYEYFRLVNDVRERLAGIAVSTDLIEYASIYYRDLGLLLNGTGADHVSYYTMTENEFENIADIVKQSTMLYYGNPITKKNHLSIFLVSQIENPDFMIELKLDEEKLEKLLGTYENDKFILQLCDTFELTNLTTEERKEFEQFYNQDTKRIALGETNYFVDEIAREYGDLVFIGLNNLDEQLYYIKQINYFFVGLLCFMFLAIVCFVRNIFMLIHKPLKTLRDAFEDLESGDFTVQIKEPKSFDFIYLYRAFNRMVKNINQLIEKEYKNELLIQKSELKQLQAQINPHFFYNTFFILQRMIKSECIDEAERLSQLMGEYFEFLTKNSEDLVTLEEEYHHCSVYLDIQMIRFGNRTKVICTGIPESAKEIRVPKLILQPIIENSFHYGLSNVAKDGILQINFLQKDRELTVSIEDNGKELSTEKLEELQQKLEDATLGKNDMEMTGMYNIHRRLMIFSDSNSKIVLSKSSLGGLCTSITFEM